MDTVKAPNACSRAMGVSAQVRAVAFCIMLTTGAVVSVAALWPKGAPTIDTRFESGEHVTFAFIAPTLRRSDALREHIRLARQAVRTEALHAGYAYSTVGIADDWSVDRGLQIIREFGPFDELVLGRNWFNSGVKSYVTDMDGRAGVPQIVVTLQEISIDQLP